MVESQRGSSNPGGSNRITIPIFPLPNVVLFPGVVMPLHIFEPRYRRLVADAIKGERRIGMALLKPGWESGYEGSPPVYPVVGYGQIEAASQLDDGRYELRLRGEGKGWIESEMEPAPYRRAVLVTSPDWPAGPELGYWVERIAGLMVELEELTGEEEAPGGGSGIVGGDGEAAATDLEAEAVPRLSGIELVHLVASELALAPEVKLGLLALDDPTERARRVAGFLDDLFEKRQAIEHHRRGRIDPRFN